jgi:glycosyltransferase involved in cell wall biosynthesis
VETDHAVVSSPPGGRPFRLLNIGASTSSVGGVRDYARVVGEALSAVGAEVELVWWERNPSSDLWAARRDRNTWLEQVASRVRADSRTWIIWHYSVWSWTVRGVPVFVPRTALALRRLGAPILLVAHEFAFPFGRRGWKGRVWATTQRAALVAAVRASTAVVATTEERLTWLRSRRWLPARPSRFVPVCSNLPATSSSAGEFGGKTDRRITLGVPGFGSGTALVSETIEALARLRSRGHNVRLLLVGAPGEAGPMADAWRAAADDANVGDAIAFSGILPLNELAQAVAGLDAVVFPDRYGPSERRTTLTAALALARPVVATDGPDRWDRLARERAIVLARPSADSLCEKLSALLANSAERDALGARGEAFYQRWMSPDVVARETLSLLVDSSC